MGKFSGIARLLCVFAICLALIIYNFCGRLFENASAGMDAFAASSETGSDFSRENSTENGENEKGGSSESISSDDKNESSQTSQSSAEASAPAAAPENVKGKIISNYISPYKAGLSYNNVYLKNGTEHTIDIKSLLTAPLSFKVEKSGSPQVLIMHTHTTETFMSEDSEYYTDAFTSRTRDKTMNMVSVGEIVAKKLNDAGIKTIHDTTEHDYPKYSGSYTRAAETILGYLEKYPSIKIVLDLHRDAVSSGNDKVKLVTEIDGKKAAQVMLVMGSQSEGGSGYPNWRENLKLAVRLQQMLEVKYPTLARPLSLTTGQYNQSLTKGSLLIEFGTDANTVAEAHYSAQMVGDALVSLLNTLT